MKIALIIAALALAIYISIAGALYFFQRRLIYFPDPAYTTPSEAALNGVREITLDTPDGERLIGWFAAAAPEQPTFLYFHGNAGTLLDRAERVRRFAAQGYGVFMPAYRGYAGSTGEPSEKALIADANLAYDRLLELGTLPKDIIPYGESLGTGVAVQLAASRPVGALVLDAPYTSLSDVAKTLYPFIPVDRFMTDRFESKRHIASVKAPMLILHGTKDQTIPIAFGKALFDAAPEPKIFAPIEGAGHSDIYQFDALARLIAFLRANGWAAKAG